MDGNSIDLFFNILTLCCGIYCLYHFFQLQAKGLDYPKCFLVPADQKPSDCLDAAAYVAYIKPRTFILGLVVLLTSTLGLVMGRLFEIQVWMQLVVIVVPLVVLVWFCVCFMKARKEYW